MVHTSNCAACPSPFPYLFLLVIGLGYGNRPSARVRRRGTLVG